LLRLEDIVKNAEHIAEYIDGMSEITFCNDHRTINAVERCIERICEATKKLGDDIKLRVGDYPGQIAIWGIDCATNTTRLHSPWSGEPQA
jgi:uncharacterized protein with HEPN domain